MDYHLIFSDLVTQTYGHGIELLVHSLKPPQAVYCLPFPSITMRLSFDFLVQQQSVVAMRILLHAWCTHATNDGTNLESSSCIINIQGIDIRTIIALLLQWGIHSCDLICKAIEGREIRSISGSSSVACRIPWAIVIIRTEMAVCVHLYYNVSYINQPYNTYLTSYYTTTLQEQQAARDVSRQSNLHEASCLRLTTTAYTYYNRMYVQI